MLLLNNFRHHAAQRGQRLGPRGMDPYSSAAVFDGWKGRAGLIAVSEVPAGDEP